MAEIKEIIEKFRVSDRFGIEEIVTLMTLMQGQLEPTSFALGLFLGGKSGLRGMDRMVPLLLSLTAANPNLQGQTSGGATTNPLQQLLPFLLLLGREDWEGHPDRSIEFVEKKTGTGK